jgi:ankyrin repeat protein
VGACGVLRPQDWLHWAAYEGREGLLRELLARPGVRPDCHNEEGLTPLHLAAHTNKPALVRLQSPCGPPHVSACRNDVHRVRSLNEPAPASLACPGPSCSRGRDALGTTACCRAALRAQVSVLLAAGAKVNALTQPPTKGARGGARSSSRHALARRGKPGVTAAAFPAARQPRPPCKHLCYGRLGR